MKNAFLKLIAIALAAAMLSLCLFSCDDTVSSDGSDTSTGNNVTQNEDSSNSSDNGNTDNGGNNGENNGGNTDSDNVSKLKYNNTVAKTSYAMVADDVYSLVKFTFNGDGKFLGYGLGMIPDDLYLPSEFNQFVGQHIRVVYNSEGDPEFLHWPDILPNMPGKFVELKPSADNTSFEGKMWSSSLADFVGYNFTFKITVDAEGRTTSFTMTLLEGDVLLESACFEFAGTEFSNAKAVSVDYEYADDEEGTIIGRHYDTTEVTCSKIGSAVMTTVCETDGKTGVADTKTVKMEITQEGNSSAIEVQYSEGFINLYIDKGNYVSATTSNGKVNYSYTYDADGKLTLWNLGNGKAISLSYDEKGLLITAELIRLEDELVAQKCIYKYNDNGFFIGYTVESNGGRNTIDFVSKTYTQSDYVGDSVEAGARFIQIRTVKISNEIILVEDCTEGFDKNYNKLFERIYEIEIKDDSKLITVPVTINFWFDIESSYGEENVKYIGYLYQRCTGEAILDVKTMNPVSVNLLIETLDANGNVISSKTSTDLDLLGWE